MQRWREDRVTERSRKQMFALRCRESHGGRKLSLSLMSVSAWEVESRKENRRKRRTGTQREGKFQRRNKDVKKVRARGKGRRIKPSGKTGQTGKVGRVRDVEKERGFGGSQQWQYSKPEAEAGHCEPCWCGLRSNFLSLRWRRSFLFFCLGFLSAREHRSRPGRS